LIADLWGKSILVTGGTMGIGLATGLAFGRQGAQCTLTYKWGTAQEDDVYRAFADVGAPRPLIVQADVTNNDDTTALLDQMREHTDRVHVFVSNVAMALTINDLDDYKLRSLFKSIEYSAWPMVDYTRRVKDVFGHYPRYVIGLSSSGPDAFSRHYDFVALSKSVLETLCRYMNYRLFDEDVRVNIVRAGLVRTESLRNTFGRDFEEFTSHFNMNRHYIPPEQVADAILALCSGLMDGVSGQVIRVDRGRDFFDNMMRLYEERDLLDIVLTDLERGPT